MPKETRSQKQSKREQVRIQHRRRQLLIRIGLIAAAVIVVGGIVGYVINNQRPAVVAGDRLIATEGQGHVATDQRVNYRNNPPSSGQHYGVTAEWGYSASEIIPEVWLHNLEHGGIVFLYHCEADCPELKSSLETLAGQLPKSKYGSIKIVVTSYPDPLPGTITALAWTRQMDLETFDADALTNFYKRYVDRGPEDVP